jgi:hypothetical protein
MSAPHQANALHGNLSKGPACDPICVTVRQHLGSAHLCRKLGSSYFLQRTESVVSCLHPKKATHDLYVMYLNTTAVRTGSVCIWSMVLASLGTLFNTACSMVIIGQNPEHRLVKASSSSSYPFWGGCGLGRIGASRLRHPGVLPPHRLAELNTAANHEVKKALHLSCC